MVLGRASRVFATAAVALGLAGCGGQMLYSFAPTKSCLTRRDVRTDRRLDFVARTATGGAMRAHLGNNFVTVAFGDTVQTGEDLEAAYERFAGPNVRSGIADVLRRYNNAVTLWHEHPSDNDLALVVGCLR